MIAYTFTLRQADKAGACASGYSTALAAYGPDLDRPLTLADIARSNGAVDALWCLRLLPWAEDIALRRRVLRGVLLPACHRALRGAAVPPYLADLDRWAAGDDAVDLRAAAAAAWAAAAAYAAYVAAYAAEASYAAAYAAAYAAEAEWEYEARAAKAASYAADAAAADAAAAAWEDELEAQRIDIIAAFAAAS